MSTSIRIPARRSRRAARPSASAVRLGARGALIAGLALGFSASSAFTPSASHALPAEVEQCPRATDSPRVPGMARRDARITERVEHRLADETLGRFAAIRVSTIDGTVCLEGTIPNVTLHDEAENRARSVEGVQDVVNRLKILLAD